MVNISGENWSGALDGLCMSQGCGYVDGYPWYFRARGQSWFMEICDDCELDCTSLPIVGFGEGGWLVEGGFVDECRAGRVDISIVTGHITQTIQLFRQGELEFVSPYPSNC